MSSSRSRLVSQIYLAAAALDGDDRVRYLDAHCPDAEVRQQVERLLSDENPLVLDPGSRVGHYEIRGQLGAGGMGTVYEAQDTRLNRTVAIKILSAGRHPEGPSLAREAQAASALNHPNIVTVYEIGHEGGADYIVMERVFGRTLAQAIGDRGIKLREALHLAAQIADAIAAAHEAGIVHRDLKPGNVMVNDRGLVKVLDFGLAKRLSPDATGADPTATMTKPGRVYGTIAYMSPEHAQGFPVDARSDIFAFGCVLYEMVSGERAFHEEGDIMTLAAVVGKDPRPVQELRPGLPHALERIIEICLRKKRIERWHSMADVKLLIDEALRDLDAPALAPRAAKPRRWFALPLAGLAGALLTAGALWILARQPAGPAAVPVLRRVTMDSGLTAFPALSRTGNLLAYSSDRGNSGNLAIWIQQIGGREPIQLTHDQADDTDPDLSPDGTRVAFRSERSGGGIYVVPALGGDEVLLAPGGRNPRFSPDGKWIAYWTGRELGGYLAGSARVFVVEAGGGQPRQVAPEMAAALYPVWSPQSDALLALGRRDAQGPLNQSLDWWVLPLEKAPARPTGALARFQQQGLHWPAWEIRPIPLAWRVDPGNAAVARVLFAAGPADAAGPGDVGNLWEIAVSPAGAIQGSAAPLTTGPGYHLQASSAPVNGQERMAFSNLEWKVGVWESALDADRGATQGEFRLITPRESFAVAPSLSRDGKTLVFLSRRMGRSGVQARDLASGKELTLVSGGPELAVVSGDGNAVAYSDLSGNLFVVPRKGGAVEKLCAGCGSPMGLSFDGMRIAYEPMQSEDLTVYDRAQGRSRVLAARPDNDTVISAETFSPDEKFVAFHAVQTRLGGTRIWIARVGNQPAPASEWMAVTDGQAEDRNPIWSPGGNLLYFLSERDGFRCVWARRLDPATKSPAGEAFAVAHFHSARRSLKRIPGGSGMMGLSVAPGRMMLAFGELTGNVWLQERQP